MASTLSVHPADLLATRARGLADRLTRGARALQAFAVGVIVHHVASVYPVEIHLAQTMGRARRRTTPSDTAITISPGGGPLSRGSRDRQPQQHPGRTGARNGQAKVDGSARPSRR
jgi:hypothetical protein